MNHMVYSSAALALLASSQVPDAGTVLRYDVLGLLFLVLVGIFLGVREAWRTVSAFLGTISARITTSADKLEATMDRISSEIGSHQKSTAGIPHETERLVRVLVHDAVQTILREFRVSRQELRDRLPLPTDSVEMTRTAEIEAAGAEVRAAILASEHRHGKHSVALSMPGDPHCPDCAKK